MSLAAFATRVKVFENLDRFRVGGECALQSGARKLQFAFGLLGKAENAQASGRERLASCGCANSELDEVGSSGGAKRRQTRIGILLGQIGIGRQGIGGFGWCLACPSAA